MFPLEQSDDDQFGFQSILSSNINSSQKQQGLIKKDDLGDIINGDFAMGGSAQPTARNTRKRQTLESLGTIIDHENKESTVNDDHNEDHGDKKKRLLAHREIERQRRQDMAKLYSSLRDLLPLEFIKGKRATSDHMHQAGNYIQYMQQNIQQLNMKRDKLKKITCSTIIGSSGTNHSSTIGGSMNLQDQNTVTVSSSSLAGGVEVLINSGFVIKEGCFPISRVLKVLSEEGLGVLSCISTKVNGRLFHTIQSDQAGDDLIMCINLSVLQQKLSNVVNNW